MADYKYQQNLYEGASYGYVKYNITPDFGTPVAPGEMITITGQAYCRNMAVKSIEVTSSSSGAYKSAYINISMAKGTATTFTIAFPMWTLSSYWGSGRLLSAPIEFTFWSAVDRSGNGDVTVSVAGQAISYLQYRIGVTKRNVQFERYAQIGGAYQKNDEGTAVIGSLGIGISEGHSVSDITVATVKITNNGGIDTRTLNIPSNVLNAALSQNGYVESSPSLFSSIEFDTAYNYTLQFTIGDVYNTCVFSVLVARAFANVHLSGCTTGGVAFGKFSASTEGSPIFECEYPSKFDAEAQFPAGIKVTEQILTIGSSFKPYTAAENSGYSGVMLRSNGFMAEIYGTVSPNSSISGSTTNYTICTIPEGLRPKHQINQICQGSSYNIWMLRINTDGVVTFARYRHSGSWESASSTAWLPFHCSWLL